MLAENQKAELLSLLNHPGYRWLESQLEARVADIHERMEKCTPEELPMWQGAVQEVRITAALVPSMVQRSN